MSTAYADYLSAYFENQRWFAGKGREFAVTHVHAMPWLSRTELRFRIEVVTVTFEDGSRDTYQFPVVYLADPDPDLTHAMVGEVDDPLLGAVTAYDATHVRAANDTLLAGFRGRQSASCDAVSFEMLDDAELPEGPLPGSVMTGEQSNTSIRYGDEAILKLFRRLSPGPNPDVEIHAALTRHNSESVAPLLGWIDGSWSDSADESHRGQLGMLQAFLRTASDGWEAALASVRDLLVEEDLHADEVGGDFAGEAERLGEATAEVHGDLADVFDTRMLDDVQLGRLAQEMGARLDRAVRVVPDLAEHADDLRRHFSALAELNEDVAVQRIHQDFHLGQTLRTVKGWKIIDFEGEPAKGLAERTGLDSPLRDVAGMLRSLDYAARVTLRRFGERPQLSYRADEWTDRNRNAFLTGYATVAGDDPRSHQVLLSAYETDKAIYEAAYEARHRPNWLPIPMKAIKRIAAA
ncbi:MAG: maltokinase N-terminal cap-like domain-containing protein [Nocardioidaceae bacterium]